MSITRRGFAGLLGAGVVATNMAKALAASATGREPHRQKVGSMKFRRIVTAENAEGKSYVLTSEEPEIAQEIPNIMRRYTLWQTGTPPPTDPVVEDLPSDLSDLMPGPGGVYFRLTVIPPDSWASEADKAKVAAMIAAKENVDRDLEPGNPMMHSTDSVDYIVMLSGELHLVLDTGEILLKPGDFVVQGGVNYSWSNRSEEPAIVAGAVVGAKRN